MSEDHLTIEEAIQRKAQGDASFAYVLWKAGRYQNFPGGPMNYLAGQFAGSAEGLTITTSLFGEWEPRYHDLYIRVFLATWHLLERDDKESEESGHD